MTESRICATLWSGVVYIVAHNIQGDILRQIYLLLCTIVTIGNQLLWQPSVMATSCYGNQQFLQYNSLLVSGSQLYLTIGNTEKNMEIIKFEPAQKCCCNTSARCSCKKSR